MRRRFPGTSHLRRSVFALLAAVGVAAGVAAPASAKIAPNLRVRGTALIDGPGAGHVVQIRGVSRSGLEYACIQGYGFFDSPHPYKIDTPRMIAAMKRWKINAVRVPLNEDCWLGVATKPGLGGAAYQAIVQRYVRALNRAHLYVVLDLHWAAPSGTAANGQLPMADADLAPAFWRSVATTFKNDHALIFDLYNEPFRINWPCWRSGCTVPAGSTGGSGGVSWPAYQAAGMQQLVDAVRGVGATQPLLLGGISYALDDSQWGTYAPSDPLHQLIASDHTYGVLAPCDAACKASLLSVHKRYPLVFGELGETDCAHSYIDRFMRFADRHGIGYLGWSWDAGGGWTCTGGPSLIRDYKGDPTPFGAGFRAHLRALGTPRRPS